MTNDRVILHSDLNGFFASVEMALDPSLKSVPLAVCGSTEDRHGIVLAKNEIAKKYGIKTGMINGEAKRRCPDLVIRPPQYERYTEFSRLAHKIYERYTDLIEPFGIDECWLDVGKLAENKIENGVLIADEIRKTVRTELGMTVSVGVSFNKIFAKLGSDMKKPDAVTVITQENFKEKVWKLPVFDLLYAGRATTDKLYRMGVRTIGELAAFPIGMIRTVFGVNGEMLWRSANGLDDSRVMHKDYKAPVKSIGHGVTLRSDLKTTLEVRCVSLLLVQDVVRRMNTERLEALAGELTLRLDDLSYRTYNCRFEHPVRTTAELHGELMRLFELRYHWELPVRAVTVRATALRPADLFGKQTDLFTDETEEQRRIDLDGVVADLRSRFGFETIVPAALLLNDKMPGVHAKDVTLPGMMYK